MGLGWTYFGGLGMELRWWARGEQTLVGLGVRITYNNVFIIKSLCIKLHIFAYVTFVAVDVVVVVATVVAVHAVP